jgi:hypothetical protein
MKKSFHPPYFIHRLCAKSLDLIWLILSWPRTLHRIATHSILTLYLVSHHYSPHSILTLYLTLHCYSPCSISILYLASHCYSSHSISTSYFDLATIAHRFYLAQHRTSASQHCICSHSSRKCSDKSSQKYHSSITHTVRIPATPHLVPLFTLIYLILFTLLLPSIWMYLAI